MQSLYMKTLKTQDKSLFYWKYTWSTSRKMLFQKYWTTPTWKFAPLKMWNFQEFSTSRGRCSKCIASKPLIFQDLVEFTTHLSFPNFRSSYFVRKCDFGGAKVEDLFTHQNIFTYLMTPPGDAEVRTSHILLFLLNLAYSLIILAVSKL